MSLKSITIVAAAAMLVGPAFAVAQTPTDPPVTVTSTQIQPENVGGEQYQPGSVSVAFVNHRAVPATAVDFVLTSDGRTLADIQALGKFSQGVTIRHTFRTDATARHQHLTITSVMFADGAIWMDGGMVPAERRQAAWHMTPLITVGHPSS